MYNSSMINTKSLTPEQEERYTTIQACIDKEITNIEASKRLSLDVRQIRRLKRKVEEYGKAGILHGGIGRIAVNKTSEKITKKIIQFMKKSAHKDFGPTFASEQLEDKIGISLSRETLRRIFEENKIRKIKKLKAKPIHRCLRERMAMLGELVQFDGSYHDWLEDKKEYCLLAAIDDATSKTTLLFEDNEGVYAVFRFWLAYVELYGRPVAIYLDKFSTYKINHKSALDDPELMTQFSRAMEDLSIKVICAHSPEAKGRVERLFNTLQDRLVKLLRLSKIKNRNDANIYIKTIYETEHNNRFNVVARQKGDAHRPLTVNLHLKLPSIFSRQSIRQVQNDYTISFKGICYQIYPTKNVTVFKKDCVTIEERLYGSIHIKHTKGVYLEYSILPAKPRLVKLSPVALIKSNKHKPSVNHPWRNKF
jgi:hypothetical protein